MATGTIIQPRRSGEWLSTLGIHLVLGAVAFVMVLPFIWMLSSSLKPADEIFGYPPRLLSAQMNLDMYRELLFERGLPRVLWNTLVVATGATVLKLLFCAMGGYGFAKYRFPGRPVLFAFLLATMVIPPAVTMVPTYFIMRDLGWIDSFWPLIVPGAASAYGIFFMRQYIAAISDELLEAARIDGVGEWGLFWRIVLPIVSPGLASLGLLFFMYSWNDFLWPLVTLKSSANFTLPLMINSFSGSAGITNYRAQMAIAVVSVLPLILLFLGFQRRLVEGITAGAVKG
jgi:ABC-type glycerol-3-phosphate transport system permease component